MEENNIKQQRDLFPTRSSPEAQPTVQGLPGVMWTPEPSVKLGLPPLIPHAAKRTEHCQTPSTISLTLVPLKSSFLNPDPQGALYAVRTWTHDPYVSL